MEGEIVLVSSNKDNGGISFINMSTGSIFTQSLKNCLCPPQGITTISGLSSYSGLGGSGDYIVATQTKKPQINIWQWGKPNVHMQCHVQEITTTITSDINGFYICGGTKGGRIFLWEVSSGNLILSWQAHFKAVTVMSFTPCGNFLISGSEDGMVRVWDIIGMVNPNHFGDQSHSKNPTPFRSWSPHNLSITGLVLLSAGSLGSTIRILTVSLDRSVIIYDLHSNRLYSTKSLPESLTCATVNPSFDFAYVGSSSGVIYSLALSHAAVLASEAHWKLAVSESRGQLSSSSSAMSGGSGAGSLQSLSQFVGHDKPITSLSHSRDNVTLVSSSLDGYVRFWNTVSRQCIQVIDPFSLSPITNAIVLLKPEMLDSSGGSETLRPTLTPLSHLKKYKSTSTPASTSTPTPSTAIVSSQTQSDYHIGTRISYWIPSDSLRNKKETFFGYADRSTESQSFERVELSEDFTPFSSNISKPEKIRRQDTFGDEFYDNWEKKVSVEEEKGEKEGDDDGFIPLPRDEDEEEEEDQNDNEEEKEKNNKEEEEELKKKRKLEEEKDMEEEAKKNQKVDTNEKKKTKTKNKKMTALSSFSTPPPSPSPSTSSPSPPLTASQSKIKKSKAKPPKFHYGKKNE